VLTVGVSRSDEKAEGRQRRDAEAAEGRQRWDAKVAAAGCWGGGGLAPGQPREWRVVSEERVGETLPASGVVDSFRAEKEGKRASSPARMGFQSARRIVPV